MLSLHTSLTSKLKARVKGSTARKLYVFKQQPPMEPLRNTHIFRLGISVCRRGIEDIWVLMDSKKVIMIETEFGNDSRWDRAVS